MAKSEIEVGDAVGGRYVATVLVVSGNYAVVTHRGHQAIAKRENGAWRELYLYEAIARLAAQDSALLQASICTPDIEDTISHGM